MTTEEAIKILDDGNWWDYLDCHIPKETRMELIDALYFANVVLCAQQEQENPKPLTLEELRGMSGKPVWIVEAPDWGHWELTEEARDYIEGRNTDFYGMRHDDPDGRYGLHKLGWLAYRHKPKED